MAKTYTSLLKAIQSGKFAPVYFLYGEEDFFINKLTDALEEQVLGSADRSFNLDLVYGNEIDAAKLTGLARAYPLMTTHRLVIAREAHRIRKSEFDPLAAYVDRPVPSTVLVFVWSQRRPPDKRTRFGKAVADEDKVVLFESKPLYENKVPEFIEGLAAGRNLAVEPKALQLLAMALGTNLSLIESELDKIRLYLAHEEQPRLTPELVERFVAIDKDFNVFELMEALGRRNAPQALTVIAHLMQSPKDNPPVMLVSQLFNYFARLYLCHKKKARSPDQVAKVLGMKPFIARQYVTALKHYAPAQIRRNLMILYEADLQLKGIRPTKMGEAHVLRAAVHQLLYT